MKIKGVVIQVIKYVLIIGFTSFLIWAILTLFTNEFTTVGKNSNLADFKKNTKVIEGKVTDVKEDKKIIFPNRYYLVVKSNEDSSKMIEVKENQFKNYQKGSKVKFRYYLELDNKIAIDLSKYKDVQNEKELKPYYQKGKIIVWKMILPQ
ncbi:hypothetical protein [Mammaliicoccus sp. F-M27]|uniref:hypothetical protein n=1 Tax=Mammaliicoccus sp. F-M27 TaxID=2898687 RepID=UPI001EFA48B3|nr:hypothetical protein [Mammaliicoccus sp. F-M27]